MKLFKIIAAFMVIASFHFITLVNAQTDQGPSLPSLVPGLEEKIDVVVKPENPAPNQPVTITLEAFGTDLNQAQISWLVNGAPQKNGIGATSFTLTAGKAGSVTNVTIYILPSNGTRITKEVRIAPASVDLVWESSSYVPPFYKGKRLYPPSGNLTLLALPNVVDNGVLVDPKTLSYKWTVNGSIQGDKSGYGKNILNLSGDVLNQPWNVSVEATSPRNGVVGSGSINVSSYKPLLLLYEDNPLYGILFNRQLVGSFDLKSTEVNIRAMPYYFSIFNPAIATYNWSINGQAITVPANQNTVTFRKPDNTEGQSTIAVQGVNRASFLQSGNNSLIINFAKSTNAPITF